MTRYRPQINSLQGGNSFRWFCTCRQFLGRLKVANSLQAHLLYLILQSWLKRTMKAIDTSSFEALPVELIKTIASVTPPEDVLRLSCVNHMFRDICWDPLLFRHIVYENRKRTLRGHESIEDAFDVDALAPVLRNNVSAWARLAIADSLASKWLTRFYEVGSDRDVAR